MPQSPLRNPSTKAGITFFFFMPNCTFRSTAPYLAGAQLVLCYTYVRQYKGDHGAHHDAEPPDQGSGMRTALCLEPAAVARALKDLKKKKGTENRHRLPDFAQQHRE